MLKPKKCPKCGASDEEISNVDEMCDDLGISKESQTDKDWMCCACMEFFNCDEAKLTSWYKDKDFFKMTISQISDVIFSDWRGMSSNAFPYADAMRDIEDISEMYGDDPASHIVGYFLSNSKDWKTETAGKVKKALQIMLDEC
jgi:hypothetical protein